jgi:hypothetical protein
MDDKLKVLMILTMMLIVGQPAFAQRHGSCVTSGGLKIGERGFDLPQPAS